MGRLTLVRRLHPIVLVSAVGVCSALVLAAAGFFVLATGDRGPSAVRCNSGGQVTLATSDGNAKAFDDAAAIELGRSYLRSTGVSLPADLRVVGRFRSGGLRLMYLTDVGRADVFIEPSAQGPFVERASFENRLTSVSRGHGWLEVQFERALESSAVAQLLEPKGVSARTERTLGPGTSRARLATSGDPCARGRLRVLFLSGGRPVAVAEEGLY